MPSEYKPIAASFHIQFMTHLVSLVSDTTLQPIKWMPVDILCVETLFSPST